MPIQRSSAPWLGPLAALTLAATAAGADVPLKWAMKRGDTVKYLYNQVETIKVKIKPSGEEESKTTDLKLDLAWKVTAVDAHGSFELTQTVERARAGGTFNGMPFDFDTKEKTPNAEGPISKALANLYDPVVGQPYALRIGPTGEIISAKVPEAVATAVAGKEFLAVADSGSLHTEAGVRNMMAQILPKFPKEPVVEGAAWTSTFSMTPGPLKVSVKTDYLVKSAGPRVVASSKIETSIDKPAGGDFTLKLNKQSGAGSFAFTPATGRLDEAGFKQSMDLTVTAGNQTIDQTIEVEQSLKLVK